MFLIPIKYTELIGNERFRTLILSYFVKEKSDKKSLFL